MSDAVPMSDEMKRVDAFDLNRFLGRFIDTNQHSSSAEYRWLAKQAETLKQMALDLHANGVAEFRIKHTVEIADMRLAEIATERGRLANQDDRLERERAELEREKTKAAIVAARENAD